MLRTTAVRLALILAHWSCPLAHLRACRASAHIALCRVAPGTGEAMRTCEKGKRANCIPAAVSAVADRVDEHRIGSRKAARASRSAWRRGDPPTRKTAGSCIFRLARAPARSISAMHAQHAQAGSAVCLWIGGRGSPARTRAREHTGPNCPQTTARSSSGVVRAGPWAYSCNQGLHGHEYDEGPARLISPHFAPSSGWTVAVARIGPGGRRRRRRRCHRRKPVLVVRRDGYSGTTRRAGCVAVAVCY